MSLLSILVAIAAKHGIGRGTVHDVVRREAPIFQVSGELHS